jgi:putative FmdB family regulatory protein
MPTYDYRCAAGHDFEKFYRKISDAESTLQCPLCGALAERRVSAGAGLVFKGSGFYITDYGKDGKKGQTPAATPGSAGESAPTDGGKGAESKPAEPKAAEPTATGAKPAESKPAAEKAHTPKGKPSGGSAE